MFDPALSPSSILNILRVKWRENPQQESQTLSNIPDDEPHPKTQNPHQQKESSQPTTLGYLDSLEELDSPSSTMKTIKGILKSPKESMVLRSHAEFGTTSRNPTSQGTRNNQRLSACFKQDEQGSPLIHENLNEKKRKKVTFSAETKKPEIRRNRRYLRIKKNVVRTNSATDLFKVEISPAPGNTLAPIAEIAANYSPRNMFKITKKTSDPGTSPRCAFNVNISHKQPNHPDDLYDDQKYTLNIPRFGKSLSSDTQDYSSLHTMLEESSVYPTANSNYLSPTGSGSARNTTLRLRTPQNANLHNANLHNANLHDIASSGPFMTRDEQFLPRVRREENLDYYAELQKKAPLIVQNMPSPRESKAVSRPISQSGDRSETFIIRKRYFIKPLVTSEKL